MFGQSTRSVVGCPECDRSCLRPSSFYGCNPVTRDADCTFASGAVKPPASLSDADFFLLSGRPHKSSVNVRCRESAGAEKKISGHDRFVEKLFRRNARMRRAAYNTPCKLSLSHDLRGGEISRRDGRPTCTARKCSAYPKIHTTLIPRDEFRRGVNVERRPIVSIHRQHDSLATGLKGQPLRMTHKLQAEPLRACLGHHA